MKKQLLIFLFASLSFFVRAQNTYCGSGTLNIPFGNTDLCQIYGAIVNNTGGTVNITTGDTLSVQSNNQSDTLNTTMKFIRDELRETNTGSGVSAADLLYGIMARITGGGLGYSAFQEPNLGSSYFDSNTTGGHLYDISQQLANTLTVTAGGFTKKLSNTITTSTVAYSSGDNIGGILTYSYAVRSIQESAVLNDIVIWSTESQTPAITIDIWASSPTGTFTNNEPQVMNSPTYWLGSVSVNSSDYVITSEIARATISGLGISVNSVSNTELFFTIVTTGTPTWTGSTTGITLKPGFLQD